MRQHGNSGEVTSSPITTVLPTDTLLYALRVMERHHVRLLAVVSETGLMVGVVCESHLLRAWEDNPLLPVGSVMALCPRPRRLPPGAYVHGQTGQVDGPAERAINA